MDGMSSDETSTIAQSFSHLPISIESVPDSGIYDAWNKALIRILGKWTVFIGAGDRIDWIISLRNLLSPHTSHLESQNQTYLTLKHLY